MRDRVLLSVQVISGVLTLSIVAPVFAQPHDVEDLTLSSTLNDRDPVDAEGRHVQVRSVFLRAGEGVEVSVSSNDFDTWLRVTGPGGLQLDSDDAPGEGTNSRLRFRVPIAGVYFITVTSYRAGETGEYHLFLRRSSDVVPSNRDGIDDETETALDCDGRACQPATSSFFSRVTQYGVPTAGWIWDPSRNAFVALQPTTGLSVPGSGLDGMHRIPGTPGVFFPSNNGVDVPPSDSFSLEENTTIDSPDDVGIHPDPEPDAPEAPIPAAPSTANAGTVYGIFIGISDYDGPNDLPYTANDAQQLASAFRHAGLVRHGDAIVLTDAQATPLAVRRAFQSLAPRVTERDTFVFFFDGHGNSNQITLRSGSIRGDQLRAMLDTIRGRQLVVIDSCYSGSLASVVRGRANRTGLFSSRADEVSYGALEVQSGGWLAYSLLQAVRGRADTNRDGMLQVNELVSYVQATYRRLVRGRQHLVVAGADQRATLWPASHGGSELAMND